MPPLPYYIYRLDNLKQPNSTVDPPPPTPPIATPSLHRVQANRIKIDDNSDFSSVLVDAITF